MLSAARSSHIGHDRQGAAVIMESMMKTNLSPSFRKVAIASVLSAMALAFVVTSGQSQSEAAPAPDGRSSQEAASIAKSKVDADAYTVEVKTTGAYTANQEGAVEIAIVPKGDYHINDKFPIKFKATDPAPEGIRYPKPVLKREDGSFEDKKGSLKVPFVATRSGKAKVSGVLSISMCSDKNCLIEKLDLDLDVDVK